MNVNGWWFLGWCAALAAALAVYALIWWWRDATHYPDLDDPDGTTVVYVIYGSNWRRPLRVGITRIRRWLRYPQCRIDGCQRHRMCEYALGLDAASRSAEWRDEVDWAARPRRLTFLRRRHHVLHVVVPRRWVAKRIERALIRRYAPPFNTAHVPADELARRRRTRSHA